MVAKTETNTPPFKLSPSERLARKRAAARLRQQRCRARKRQATLQEKREQIQSHVTQDSRTHSISEPHRRPPIFPARHGNGLGYWGKVSSPSEPIYHCVSFESQRSFEEAHKSAGTEPGEQTSAPVVSPERKPVKIVSVSEDSSDESLVSEEEAAIAAMLSLKTGPKKEVVSCKEKTPQPVKATRSPHATKFQYYRSWKPRYYEPYEYGRPPRASAYYKMPVPPPPPPQYRYYPTYQRYSRYE